MVVRLGQCLNAGILFAGLLVSACGPSNQSPDQSSDSEPQAATASAGAASGSSAPSAFAICSTCHSSEKGRNGIGPTLFGIVGSRSGAVENFNFSPAMKNANIVWDEKNLDQFIESPQALVPGTRMPFGGIKDPAKRAEIIGYLATLK